MAQVWADRVLERTLTTGTGALSLEGTITGCQTVATAIGDGNSGIFVCRSHTADEWEIFEGTYTESTNTLSRDNVRASSTGSAVSFTRGIKTVEAVLDAAALAELLTGDMLPDAFPIVDSTVLVHDAVDDTKAVRIDAGGVTTETTAVISVTGNVNLDAASGTFQPRDAQLSAIAGLTPAADQFVYWTAETTAALATVTPFARTLLDDESAVFALATLGGFAKDGSVTMTGHINVGGFQVQNMGTPTSAAHAATKAYVDGLVVTAGEALTKVANALNVNVDETTITINGDDDLEAIPGGIDHDALLNYVADEHIDWTVNAGASIHNANILQSAVTQHQAAIDHGTIAGLGDDDHSQYLLLAGRAGGQTLNGGNASGQHLELFSTSHATKGEIRLGNLFYVSATSTTETLHGGGTLTKQLCEVRTTLGVIPGFRLRRTPAANAANECLGEYSWWNVDTSDDGAQAAALICAWSVKPNGAGGYMTFHTTTGEHGLEGRNAPEQLRLHQQGQLQGKFVTHVISANESSGTVTYDWATSNYFETTLTGNHTLAFSNPMPGQSVELRLLQDGTGGHTVTWPSGITWDGGSTPTLPATAAHACRVRIFCRSAGVYDGMLSAADLY